MRANAVKREPSLRAQNSTLYEWQMTSRASASRFVLHDGPPFANGELHMGHFLNKVLKDIINRYKLMRGYRIHYVPGWDCHGLPIEQKALQQASKSAKGLSPIEIRQRSKELAETAIQNQLKDFENWGILAD